MSNIHNAGPDDETSDADAEAEISDSSVEAEEDSNQNASKQGSVMPGLASRSATDPTIKNH